ncbi:polyprenol monophosphomannose synthase [Psychroflexus sp. MBR-150]|jgi:dolichol-phosphate mannosyltransferase
MPERIVIIPTYNEIENIERVVRNVFAQDVNFHILIVDDSSPDGTADRVKTLQEEYPERLNLLVRTKKEGLGRAYIAGFKWALNHNYDYIFEMDADYSHNPNDLIRLYNACFKQGADLSIGSRYSKGVNVINWPMNRVLLSWIASWYVRVVTQIPICDTTAGFVCYHRSVLEKINFDKIKFVGYAFQIEMKYKAYKLGFDLKEVPIIFTDRTKGKSKMDKRIIWEAVLGVINLRLKSIFFKQKFN